jgi:hypothetical protein
MSKLTPLSDEEMDLLKIFWSHRTFVVSNMYEKLGITFNVTENAQVLFVHGDKTYELPSTLQISGFSTFVFVFRALYDEDLVTALNKYVLEHII